MQMAAESIGMCSDDRQKFIEDPTYWIQQDKPEMLNRLLIEYFSKEE